MKKIILALALVGLVAAPAMAMEPASKSAAPAPAAKQETTMEKSSTAAPSATSSATTQSTTRSAETLASAEMPAGLKKATGAKGEFLTTANGMTVYTFSKDQAGKSTCTGECAKNWPAVTASATDKAIGSYSVIKTATGSQWAYEGKPLYTYSKDAKAGDMLGASIPNWTVATISAAPAPAAAH